MSLARIKPLSVNYRNQLTATKPKSWEALLNRIISLLSQGPFTFRCKQCDQIKIAKCLYELPKNDFTIKMIDFNTFTKIA